MLTYITYYATESQIIKDSSKSLSLSNFLLFHVLIYVLLPLIYIVLKVFIYIKLMSHDKKSHILLHNESHSSSSKYKIPSFWLILNFTTITYTHTMKCTQFIQNHKSSIYMSCTTCLSDKLPSSGRH